MQRVVANLEKPCALLKTTIEQYCNSFRPALFESDIEQVELSLMMLSCCNGSLGIRDPVATSAIGFQSSIEGTKMCLESVRSGMHHKSVNMKHK